MTETPNQTNPIPVQWYPGMCILNIKPYTNLIRCVQSEKLLHGVITSGGTPGLGLRNICLKENNCAQLQQKK